MGWRTPAQVSCIYVCAFRDESVDRVQIPVVRRPVQTFALTGILDDPSKSSDLDDNQ